MLRSPTCSRNAPATREGRRWGDRDRWSLDPPDPEADEPDDPPLFDVRRLAGPRRGEDDRPFLVEDELAPPDDRDVDVDPERLPPLVVVPPVADTSDHRSHAVTPTGRGRVGPKVPTNNTDVTPA